MRKNLSTVRAFTPLAIFALAGAAAGQQKVGETVSGVAEYRTYCAVCHGQDGRGDGPLANDLRVRPADLTLIAKRNNARYPDDKVRRLIDGRSLVKGHGPSDMPVWGDAFRNSVDGYSEARVKEKIEALVEYLKTIQEPAK
jgi:mono/diheme cytochrome c family protein